MLPRLLQNPRFIYQADTLAALSMGLALMLLAPTLTQLAGWAMPSSFLFGIGVFLMPWGLFNYWMSRHPTPGAVWVHFLVDGGWVLGSVLLLVLHAETLTALGNALIAGQAVSVAAVFALKAMGFPAIRAAAA
ncbi:hypothetical protein [Comamonas sp. JC664]|uniref:hypothetical protein n=1 Tax=Comamonas sp. JC664 TaxID=2801917 RepID=UPI00174DC442|nr:hypothetical protein [Comamonas sp. JC664]MBL0699114.1 hypothetical protein [Comamonas sp. JC664]GHG80549.1 hypothetical protein GCM10012319_33600 [Comamonas sp. KCTC 72670]